MLGTGPTRGRSLSPHHPPLPNEAAGAVKESIGKMFSERMEAEGRTQKEEGKHQVEDAKVHRHDHKAETVGNDKDTSVDRAKPVEAKRQAESQDLTVDHRVFLEDTKKSTALFTGQVMPTFLF